MTPASRAEREFEDLATYVSETAAGVDCSPEAYRDGLQTIIETLRADLAASQEGDREAAE